MKPAERSTMQPEAVGPAAANRPGAGLAAALRRQRPLVHCLTNPVSMNDVANALLAVGASPIMADDASEAAEITARADALLLNLGVPNPGRLEAMLLCGHEARARGIPIVFDPVGVALTAFRRQGAARILSELQPDIIRGNFSEISFLAGQAAAACGVDNDCRDEGKPEGETGGFHSVRAERLAQSILRAETVSRTFGAITVLTGERDVVTDGQYTQVQAGASVWLTRMTGAGCILGGLVAAYAAAARGVAPSDLEPVARLGMNDPFDHSEASAARNPSARLIPVLEALRCYRAAAAAAERRMQNGEGTRCADGPIDDSLMDIRFIDDSASTDGANHADSAQSGSSSFRVFLIDALCTTE